jgi:D-glycero-alpha-D-manno-heptose-7-phosphate kinase
MITSSSAPPGSGLGTSASISVALLAALANLAGRHFLRYQLAELASEIERVDLGILGGKQDHYASAYGGISFMEFHGEEVRCCPLSLHRDTVLELQQNLVLAYTGKSRLSGNIHEKVTGAYNSGEKSTVDAIEGMKRIAHEVKDTLFEGDLDRFAALLSENWKCQKALHPSVTNEQIDEAFAAAMEAGAVGGKACGAGGGGCLLYYCRPDTKHRVRRALENLDIQIIEFQFDSHGVETWQP